MDRLLADKAFVQTEWRSYSRTVWYVQGRAEREKTIGDVAEDDYHWRRYWRRRRQEQQQGGGPWRPWGPRGPGRAAAARGTRPGGPRGPGGAGAAAAALNAVRGRGGCVYTGLEYVKAKRCTLPKG